MRSRAKSFDDLRAFVEDLSIVDCHDHTATPGPRYADPMQVIVSGYYVSDVHSMAGVDDFIAIMDASKPWEERWRIFEPHWKRSRFTGYGQVSRRVLEKFYGVTELTLESLKGMEGRLLNLEDEKEFIRILDEAKIVARIVDLFDTAAKPTIDGAAPVSPRARLTISLPSWHGVRSAADVQVRGNYLGRVVTSLDEYLDVARTAFGIMKDHGAVAFKDQSAYVRPLSYGNPSRGEAEATFNKLMMDHRFSESYPDGLKPLDDFLFHEFMRMARDLDLPVQIHTGHMAGFWNDVRKTNAALMQPVFELHRDVRFDLFHANWPYSGDLLYLAKNYPNVCIDLCWANIIDPIYCQRMLKQAVSAVPHGKIHGYGSDYGGQVDRAWAHAAIARDNIAIALSELIEDEWFGLDEAKEIAQAWLFDNPNRFFRLGL